ncbi:ArsA-related P-loop ATPase [uncultured Pseudokineococcus sp.]|uniref:ArsA-related P-loop ATPase n=1 Tax=uncultured Pseudokineococcus sp. TaxID=1642928 RepID=UPI00260A9CED|nr:ArsA-related P-loop ATPase [uncultured Pseudokineococcus sp.]
MPPAPAAAVPGGDQRTADERAGEDGLLFPATRLHVVTGKGGTGKTTTAAALAVALSRGGRRVLLCEVEDRQGIARLFGIPPLPYEERTIAATAGGGEVLALAVEPRAALLEYLTLFYKLGRAGRALDKVGAIDFATTVAPGVRDVLLTGKVYEAVRRRRPGRGAERPPAYDAVVLDAPPTGRIGRFLNVNSEVSGIARVGPVASQAESVMRVLRSAETRVHLVTLLEEMPVQETLDAVAELEAVGLPVGAVVVDQIRGDTLPVQLLDDALSGRVPASAVREGLVEARVVRPDASGASVVEGLLAEAGEHDERLALQEREHETLAATGRPLVELPLLPGGVDHRGLEVLADRLTAQGLA